MISNKKNAAKMVYTPQHHIPIGEAMVTEDGEYALRIKKPKGQEMEIVSIGKLVTQVVQAVQSTI